MLGLHYLLNSWEGTPREHIVVWWANWGIVFIAAGILYIPIVFTGKYWAPSKPINMRYVRIVHNFIFAVFSTVGAIELLPTFIGTWQAANYSFHGTVCQGFFITQDTYFWVHWFVLSKIFELLESLYFVLEHKPLRFLHWYHHIVTYVFSVWSLVLLNPSAIYFVWMNLVVHAVMYVYFFISSVTGRPPSWGIIVTIGQITQMIIGVAVCYEVFNCEEYVDPINAWFGLLMYLSYVFLFVRFFVLKYIFGHSDSERKPKTPATTTPQKQTPPAKKKPKTA